MAWAMSIESRRELELTQDKLKLLEERLAVLVQQPEANRRAHEWLVRSVTQTINQLKEEIARFQSRAPGTAKRSSRFTFMARPPHNPLVNARCSSV